MKLVKKEVTVHEQKKVESYLRRYRLTDDSIIITRISNKRRLYILATDQNNIDYKIPFTYIQKAYAYSPRLRHSINKVELFTNMSKEVFKHKDKYDYSLVKNEDLVRKKKVTLICKVNNHGEFKIRYDLHLYNENSCPKCVSITMKRARNY